MNMLTFNSFRAKENHVSVAFEKGANSIGAPGGSAPLHWCVTHPPLTCHPPTIVVQVPAVHGVRLWPLWLNNKFVLQIRRVQKVHNVMCTCEVLSLPRWSELQWQLFLAAFTLSRFINELGAKHVFSKNSCSGDKKWKRQLDAWG